MVNRFAVEQSYFRPGDNSVKPKAFMPGKDGVTSVFVLDHMSHEQRIAHGQVHVGDQRAEPKQVLGYAEVPEAEISRLNLTLARDEPPQHHYNVGAWPDDLDQLKALAAALAEEAVFRPA